MKLLFFTLSLILIGCINALAGIYAPIHYPEGNPQTISTYVSSISRCSARQNIHIEPADERLASSFCLELVGKTTYNEFSIQQDQPVSAHRLLAENAVKVILAKKQITPNKVIPACQKDYSKCISDCKKFRREDSSCPTSCQELLDITQWKTNPYNNECECQRLTPDGRKIDCIPPNCMECQG